MSLSPDAPANNSPVWEHAHAVSVAFRTTRMTKSSERTSIKYTALLGSSVVGLVAFLIAALVSTALPFVPRVHDEFSYLLAADTLLQGRLANPSPEVWQPFQSFHILVEPSYASKYPLGNSSLVAIGWAVFGRPIAGCWIAAGLCAASMVWMLCGITRRRWAILGGLLVACHPAMQVGWSQTLMSGWLTGCGSALLIGGVFRLRRRFSLSAAAISGVGIAVLALTRPFEGLVATILSSIVLWQLWSGWRTPQKLLLIARIVPVASVPVAVALGLIGMQNYAVTGSLGSMPYQVHEQKYGIAPLFVFGTQREPASAVAADTPAAVRDYHQGWSLESYQSRRGMPGWLSGIAQAGWLIWDYWFELSLVSLLTCGYLIKFRVARLLTLAVAVQVLFSASVCWIFPHYLAPVLPWLLALAVLGLQRLSRGVACLGVCKPSQTHRVVLACLAIQCVLLGINAHQSAGDPNRNWAKRRSNIAASLADRDGLHLVLVHYGPEHSVHQEWVYNAAELASAKVLWARGERADWNARLSEAYASSHFIWQLEADLADAQPKLIASPHPASACNASQ